MAKKYVAYQSNGLVVEWYYKENGRSPALEYFERLDPRLRNKLTGLFVFLARDDGILDTVRFRHEGDQIYVFKVGQHRFFCFFAKGSRVIISNAHHKKKQKVSRVERLKAAKARESFNYRTNKGVYYDDES